MVVKGGSRVAQGPRILSMEPSSWALAGGGWRVVDDSRPDSGGRLFELFELVELRELIVRIVRRVTHPELME